MALRTNDLELVPITLFAYTEAQRRKGMITLRNSFFGVAVVLFGYGVVLFLKAGSDSPWFLTMFCGFFLLFLGGRFFLITTTGPPPRRPNYVDKCFFFYF